MIALIDADIIKYSVGFACQKSVYTEDSGEQILISQIKGGMAVTSCATGVKVEYPGLRSKKAVLEEIGGSWEESIVPEPDHYVGFTVKRMIHGILKQTGAEQYLCYLSRGDCFRVGVYPEYKANRKDVPKPLHAKTVEEYLLKNHPTQVYEEIEADDAMGIYQSQSLLYGAGDTVICSIDKDLRMIPGWHFNWNTGIIDHVEPEDGMFSFWCQTLTGDATDNIPGLQGIGKKGAEKLLADCKPDRFKRTVLEEYAKQGWGEEELERNARLLWILRKPLYDTYGMSYEEFFKQAEA